ncbi:hypothetical protein CPB84DRAFT_1686407 [Gymnopilus junonius]|uniref:BTB domain-containing protein n=1 Tax=Gymnopilus junonius TaxID=109634 RepID=A0A9P5TIX8_GYMJU|nr:hypothetical protein CPB84DRAFT_1686407 [Gymnopilus junonius]
MSLPDYHFDSPDSDVILLTSEAERTTEFHVHKCILAAASPFFNVMFSLPQSLPDSLVGKAPNVPVSEPSRILDAVLRYVYQVERPVIDSLDDLIDILAAAVKYEFTTVITIIRTLLISPRFLQSSPIRVYAVACRYDFDDEVKLASRQTLDVHILDTTAPPLPELKYISAYDYHRLLRLHAIRSSSAIKLLECPGNLKCMQCNGSAFTMHDAPKWWYQWEKKAREELQLRPTTKVVFSLDFLFGAVRASGCSRCPESLLDSWKFLQGLREEIDALPATIEMD